jgi:hypothetical protein
MYVKSNTIEVNHCHFRGTVMALFSYQNHTAMQDVTGDDTGYLPHVENTVEKLSQLHEKLYPQLINHGLDLYPSKKQMNVVFESASTSTKRGVIALQYMRTHSQAIRVERLMGRDETSNNGIESRRHPTIEVRLTPEHLTVELILSPYAWWDQQNFVGKLSIDRHHTRFYELLKKLDGETKVGYWRGVQLDEMYVKVDQLYRQHIWDEWISTFDAGKDWFRVGVWYTPESEALSQENILAELVGQIRGLYTIYEALIWSSDNNYREFYNSSKSRRY